MSLMGVVMMAGIVVSNSILIVEFTHRLLGEGMPLREAVQFACRVRMRPILMTSLATVIGLIPMAAKLGTGSEAYAPLARAIIGGLSASVALTVFIVPAAILIIYRRTGVQYPSPRARRGNRACPGQRLVIVKAALLLFLSAIPLALAAQGQDQDQDRAASAPMTLAEAESAAMLHAPALAAAYFRAEAAKQAVRETRSAFFPQVNAEVSAVGTGNGMRMNSAAHRKTTR